MAFPHTPSCVTTWLVPCFHHHSLASFYYYPPSHRWSTTFASVPQSGTPWEGLVLVGSLLPPWGCNTGVADLGGGCQPFQSGSPFQGLSRRGPEEFHHTGDHVTNRFGGSKVSRQNRRESAYARSHARTTWCGAALGLCAWRPLSTVDRCSPPVAGRTNGLRTEMRRKKKKMMMIWMQ